MKISLYTLLFVIGSLLSSCGGDTLPKPKGGLRLDYTPAVYAPVTQLPNCPFNFEANSLSEVKYQAHDCDINIEYPAMHATIYLTYKPVEGNLKKLLKDAQKFTYEHTIKADNIASTVFANDSTHVYGMFTKCMAMPLRNRSFTQLTVCDTLFRALSTLRQCPTTILYSRLVLI